MRALHPAFVVIYPVDTSGALEGMQDPAPPGLECLPSDHPWLQSLAAAGRPIDRQSQDTGGGFGGPLAALNPECVVPIGETRRLDYVNCGHNPPLVVRARGQIDILPPTAMALGFVDTLRCAMATVQFAPGDALVACADGIVEALSDDGEEFGDDRLTATVLANRARPAEALLESILSEVQRFNGSEQDDGLTLVVGKGVGGHGLTPDAVTARRSSSKPNA